MDKFFRKASEGCLVDAHIIVNSILIPYDISGSISDTMYYTNLNGGLRENIFTGNGKSVQVIGCRRPRYLLLIELCL